MTDMEATEFLRSCYRYAKCRRAPQDSCDEFGAWAWEKRCVMKWRSTIPQLWKSYCREEMGQKGFARDRVRSAIKFRPVYSGPDQKGMFIEERIGQIPQEQFPLRRMAKRDQMIVILVEAGFSLAEIHHELSGKSEESLRESVRKSVRSQLKPDEPYVPRSEILQRRREQGRAAFSEVDSYLAS